MALEGEEEEEEAASEDGKCNRSPGDVYSGRSSSAAIEENTKLLVHLFKYAVY